ncbi:hypothetical protein Clacol_002000 [Clathrus columnatus]|uniref:SET domain-containing protein n=1 Tax=Clathrus columnatus TaxID=1419009 RepID=A0AAV5A7B0_9AGAM|nr:hypothetical protein Clacol_002000 [Clathrus columnatus]
MRISTAALSAVVLAASTLAQDFTIQLSLDSETGVVLGQPMISPTTPFENVAIAFGVQHCGDSPCSPDDNDEILGQIVKTSLFNPTVNASEPFSPPSQSFTLDITGEPGSASLHATALILVGSLYKYTYTPEVLEFSSILIPPLPVKAVSVEHEEEPSESNANTKIPQIVASQVGLYPDLPTSLSIRRQDALKGRGLWSNITFHRDWKLHKHECSAITRWITTASPDGSPPPEAIRALGRILYARKAFVDDQHWWKEIEALQSHRSSLPPSATESYTHLAHALVRYLNVLSPTELEPYGLHSAGDIVDLISRFTTNAFTLTSPLLLPLGTCLSPVTSFLNHSCQPNAVVVFPKAHSRKTTLSEPILNVVALRDIPPNEEVLISYVDTTFSTPQRQQILKETYNFTCTCPLCSKSTTDLDQHEVVFCPKDCGGRCNAPFLSSQHVNLTWRCSSCNTAYSHDAVIKVDDKRRLGQEALDKVSKLQQSDPIQALKITTNIIPLLINDLPPSAHPLLNILRIHQVLLIDKLSSVEEGNSSQVIDDVIRTAGRVVVGLTAILEEGHPILGIALAELGKLLAVDEPPEPSDAFNFPPRGPARLALALETLKRAFKSLRIGFGEENEGGEVGVQIREEIVQLEKELQAWQQGIRNLWEDTVLQRKYEAK